MHMELMHFCRRLLSPLVPSTLFLSLFILWTVFTFISLPVSVSLLHSSPHQSFIFLLEKGSRHFVLFPRPPLLFFPPPVSVSSPLFSLPLSSSQWDYAKREAPWRFAVDFKAISCSVPAFFSSYLCTNTHTHTH